MDREAKRPGEGTTSAVSVILAESKSQVEPIVAYHSDPDALSLVESLSFAARVLDQDTRYFLRRVSLRDELLRGEGASEAPEKAEEEPADAGTKADLGHGLAQREAPEPAFQEEATGEVPEPNGHPSPLSDPIRASDDETVQYQTRMVVTTRPGTDALASILAHVDSWLRDKGIRGADLCPDHPVTYELRSTRVRCSSFRSPSTNMCVVEQSEEDRDFTFRRWVLRIALTQEVSSSSRCVVNLILSSTIDPGYFGFDRTPEPTVPRLVRLIGEDRSLTARAGDGPLSAVPEVIDSTSSARELIDYLADPNRMISALVLASDREGSHIVEKTSELAWLLVGMARTFLVDLSRPGIRELMSKMTLEKTGGYDYGPPWASAVVYLPGCSLRSGASKKSQCVWFVPQYLSKLREPRDLSFAVMLRRGLTRTIGPLKGEAATIADVDRARARLESEQRLSELARGKAQGHESADLEIWQGLAESYQDEAEEQRVRADQAENSLAEARAVMQSLSFSSTASSGELDGVRGALLELPTTLSQALRTVDEIWPNRILVLPEALASASEWEKAGGGAISEEWRIVSSCAVELWSIVFGPDPTSDIEDAYKCQTGFELAMSEGRSTQSNPSLMALRKRTYEGSTYECVPHIKGKRRRGKDFRLYFAIDRDRRLIVIGHAGSHLMTAGTQRM